MSANVPVETIKGYSNFYMVWNELKTIKLTKIYTLEILEAVEAEPADDICKEKRLSLKKLKNNLQQTRREKNG